LSTVQSVWSAHVLADEQLSRGIIVSPTEMDPLREAKSTSQPFQTRRSSGEFPL